MLVSLYYGKNKWDEKEITNFSELNNQEKNNAIFALERRQDNLHHINYTSKNFAADLSAEAINERIVKHFTDIKKDIIASCSLITKEHTFPRDMTEERGWSNEIIEKEPFNLSETIKDIYLSISFFYKEEALANHFNWVSKETREFIKKEKNETFKYLKSFLPLFKHMHPETDFIIDKKFHNNEAKEHLKEIISLNLNFNFKALSQVLALIGAQRSYTYDRGANADCINEPYTPEMDNVAQTLLVLAKHNAFSYFPNILGFIMTRLLDKNQEYFNSQYYVSNFTTFDKFFNTQISYISSYSSNERDYKLQELYNQKSEKEISYNRQYKRHLAVLEKFKQDLFSWCEMFNSSFSEKSKEKKLITEKHQDCSILSFNEINLLLLPLPSEYTHTQEIRGIILNDEQLNTVIKEDSIRDTLLNKWDILGENNQRIDSTSFRSMDNFLTEINQQKYFEAIFKASNNGLVVLE